MKGLGCALLFMTSCFAAPPNLTGVWRLDGENSRFDRQAPPKSAFDRFEHEEPSLHFALLVKLARDAGLSNLSMGMSADYEAAIRLGATHVRIGTAIFGARPA